MRLASVGERFGPLLLIGLGLAIGLAAGLLVFFGLPAWAGGGAADVAPAGGLDLPPASSQGSAPAPVAGAPAPDFTLNDLDGKPLRLADQRGRVVLINFWATWCGPCRVEMPAIQARYQALQDQGFTVLAVDSDDVLQDIVDFAREFGLTFPILLDPDIAVNDLYRVRAYPTTFIIDREGVITRVHIGLMSEEQLDSYLAAAGLE